MKEKTKLRKKLNEHKVGQASACLVLSSAMRKSKPDRLKPVLLDSNYGSGKPGVATIPAMRRIS
jgi:hypothetical protein